MKIAHYLYVKFCLCVLLATVLAACAASGPQNRTETVYAGHEALAVYATWIVEEHDAGKLIGERYEKSKVIYKGARAALKDARTAALNGDNDAFVVAMTAANTLLAELARYKGGQQ